MIKKILVTAHDSGGAEIVSAWVRANPQNHYFFVLQGPAVNIFTSKYEDLHNNDIDVLPQLLSRVDFVLTGTSWNSDLERIIILTARENNIFVVSYLDHWTNYIERFRYGNSYCFPDEIWVGDRDAEQLANSLFNGIKIRNVPNQYFNDIVKEYNLLTAKYPNESGNLLYLCEPISAVSNWKCGNENFNFYTEFTAMQFFFKCINESSIRSCLRMIKIRLHPSEEKDKYKTYIEQQCKDNLPVHNSSGSTLLEDLAWANCVVGISSMALVVAAMLDKNVFTCVPDGAIMTKLPLNSIQPFNLVSVITSLHKNKFE